MTNTRSVTPTAAHSHCAPQLLNCDDHAHILRKHKRDAASARPDICHQMLMNILDSPMNKAGNVQVAALPSVATIEQCRIQVYIHTSKNVLIRIHKSIRIPRTFRRFAGLMGALARSLSVCVVMICVPCFQCNFCTSSASGPLMDPTSCSKLFATLFSRICPLVLR